VVLSYSKGVGCVLRKDRRGSSVLSPVAASFEGVLVAGVGVVQEGTAEGAHWGEAEGMAQRVGCGDCHIGFIAMRIQ
jgi:hypothetical protein